MLKNILLVASLIALCLGLATCEKSCDVPGGDARPADAKKPVAQPRPAAQSKWVGKWVSASGTASYVIESEKNGSLYGYIPRSGGGKEKVVMKLSGTATASYVTPVGVRVTFRLSGGNRLTVSSLGVGAKALTIVK